MGVDGLLPFINYENMNVPDILLSEFLYDMDGLAPVSLSLIKTLIKNFDYGTPFDKIANISCGYGNQSIILYELTNAEIIAIDHRDKLIEIFQRELKFQKLDNHIIAKHSKLEELPFMESELDLLWSTDLPSEFTYRRVLGDWHQFIKEDGYIVTSAYCWNSSYKPKEISNFLRDCGIEIDHFYSRIKEMEHNGFVPISHFTVPCICWYNFFYPINAKKEQLSKKYTDNDEVQIFFKNIDLAIDLFEKYNKHYSYTYFVGKKLSVNEL